MDRQVQFIIVLLTVFIVLSFSRANCADSKRCEESIFLEQKAEIEEDADLKEKMLSRAVELCPSNVLALNNYAVLKENNGEIELAGDLYGKAIDIDPNFAIAYAGFGDIRSKQGRYWEAASAYQIFLKLLKEERKNNDPLNIVQYAPIYRSKLENALTNANVSGIATSDEIIKSLSIGSSTKSVRRTRGISVVVRAKANINLKILFDSGSSELKQYSMVQITEIASALKSKSLIKNSVLIEGHTDNVGSNQFNLNLSNRRAKKVKSLLISLGIDESRLNTRGCGENKPIASNEIEKGRALNRRVTIVNYGPESVSEN
jgi:outer membrane protein OmpA-like peptidoglycan-associated protein